MKPCLVPVLLSASALGSVVASAAPQTPLKTEFFAFVTRPVDLTYAPGDPARVFIVEQDGRIMVVENGTTLGAPFLDLTSEVQFGGEQGLLGLAFHPDYLNNGRFFVNYTDAAGTTCIAEYSASPNDPNVADPNRVQFIAQIAQPFDTHNGGAVRFGPDGKLYVGMGDGGGSNDPNGRAQNGADLLGKMLRFDVDASAPFVPTDNPFVGDPGVRDEIWHLGLRNPWRFSFDRSTGDMWIADVGEAAREEVNFIPSGLSAQNLGWRCLEGTVCTGLSGCSCTNGALRAPIHEYDHTQGCSISGGVVYRGSAIPDLAGTYFFADFCTSQIWSLEYDGSNVQNFTNRTAELQPQFGSINTITGFGEDASGEVYVLTYGGGVFKILPDGPACGFTNYCAANPTASGPPASISGMGSTSISGNAFTLTASTVPAGTAGIFVYGPAQTQSPSGVGNICIAEDGSMPLVRLYPAVIASAAGNVSRHLDFTEPQQAAGPGAILSGATLNFQFWFRDLTSTGAQSWNFTNGLSVTFCP